MRARYIEGLPGYDVQFTPDREIKSPGANARIDAAIRKGVMPNSMGGASIDPNTGMARGVQKPVPVQAPGSKTGKLGKAWTGLSVANALADSAANDSTARYAQRFGVNEPTGDGSIGDMAKFAALRAGGFASDLGNNMLLGMPGKLFYRDQQQPGGAIIPEAAAAELPRTPAATPAAVVAQPQAAIPSTAPPEMQEAMLKMGIHQGRVLNHGAGVDYATANQIERQGRYGGKDGMFTQLQGYGDQNAMFGRASRPGGKINEFYGVGSGKASNPASMGINILPAAAMMQPETRGPGLGERAAIMERNIAEAEARGDGRAANAMRAELNALSGDRQQSANPLQQQLAQVMSMPDNTFGERARKRAAMAALSKGIQIQDMESRNALEREKAGFIAQESGQRIEAGRLTLAEQKRASTLRDQILAETDPAKRAELTRQLNIITGKANDASGREVVTGDNGVFLVDKATGASMAMQGIQPKRTNEKMGVSANPMGGYAVTTQDGRMFTVNHKGEVTTVQIPGTAPQNQAAAAPGKGPAVGEVRTINGQRAQWDGRGWLAVQ